MTIDGFNDALHRIFMSGVVLTLWLYGNDFISSDGFFLYLQVHLTRLTNDN